MNLQPSDKHILFIKDGVEYIVFASKMIFMWTPTNNNGIVFFRTFKTNEKVEMYRSNNKHDLEKQFTRLVKFHTENWNNLPVRLPEDFFLMVNQKE